MGKAQDTKEWISDTKKWILNGTPRYIWIIIGPTDSSSKTIFSGSESSTEENLQEFV
jgi:hypothetical protein